MSGEKKHGKFIVIEGTDGSGKTEQFERLILRLPEDIKFATLDFPQYGRESSYFVRRYLKGEYGSGDEVGPKKASLFFALDRFDVSSEIKKWLGDGKLVVSNRYVASNMGYQGGKIEKKEEREKLFRWIHELEFETLGIPRPDLNIILHMPAVVSYELISKKGEQDYIGGKGCDIREADFDYLKRAEEAYLEIAKLFPKDFTLVECVDNGKLLPIEEVHERIWKVVAKVIGV